MAVSCPWNLAPHLQIPESGNKIGGLKVDI